MAKKNGISYTQILSDINKRNFKPLYFFMGEEPYYIDLLTDAIIKMALDENERDFNQTIIYGADTNVAAVINQAKRYPMMAQRQLVVVKEAQRLENIENLFFYAQKPLMSTILVLNYKNGTLKNKKLLTEIEKNGIVFESKKVYESSLPAFINNYVAAKGITIETKAVSMLADYIGTDLSRLSGELDKLIISINNDARITDTIVEKNVGISKEYNNFELLNAIINRNILKANQIQQYFEKNSKTNPFIVTLSVLYNFFSNLMLVYFMPNKSENTIREELKLAQIFQARNYAIAARNFNAYKCINIIELLREYDAKSKGIGNNASSYANDADLLKELIYKILH
ncbi:MAG: DNA polymerase III subunit delta [Bacteroidaceae bacterium]|nr:DNA polymerase III subunit delta [Bacteroidaceae bacterium]